MEGTGAATLRDGPVRARWGGGVEWAPVQTEGAEGYWDDGITSQVGFPTISVVIAGQLTRFLSARWMHGRPHWFAPLEASAASFTLPDIPNAVAGDSVMIHSELAVHWTGRVSDVSWSEDVNGFVTGEVSAEDSIARVALAELKGYSHALTLSTSSVEIVADILDDAGVGRPTVVFAPSDYDDPVGDITKVSFTYSGNAKELLDQFERWTNGALFPMPDGPWQWINRGPHPDADVETVQLDGRNAPDGWRQQTSPALVINEWIVTDEDGSEVASEELSNSVLLYGRHTYAVEDAPLTGNPYITEIRGAYASPHDTAVATFPVKSKNQYPPKALPLDFVSRHGDLWQVLMVEHEVSVGNVWRATLTLEWTQNATWGDPDPNPDDPPEPPTDPDDPEPPDDPDDIDPPQDPDVTIESQTYALDKEARIYRTSSGSREGTDTPATLPVGFYQGYRYRALLAFDMVPSGAATGATGIRTAKLHLHLSSQVDVAFGSNPRVVVERITAQWTGTATKWDGPKTVRFSRVVRNLGSTEGAEVIIDITDIARRWFHKGDNQGIRIRAVNEDWAGNTTEFEGGDAELVVRWEVPP